jgi:transposase
MSGWAWARRSAPTTPAETGPRPSRGGAWELVSRGLGVSAAELSGWRDRFLAGGKASLKSRPADARDAEVDRLQAKVGELTMATELLEAKIERLEGHRPLARRRSRP